jgi:hypothetical protein
MISDAILTASPPRHGRRRLPTEKAGPLPDAEAHLKAAIVRLDHLHAHATFAYPPGAYAIAVQFTLEDLKALSRVIHAAAYRLREMVKTVAYNRENDRILHRRERRASAGAPTEDAIVYPSDEESQDAAL